MIKQEMNGFGSHYRKVKQGELINMKTEDRTENLCDSCRYAWPLCRGLKRRDLEFGDGIGFDNVISCRVYRPKKYALDITIKDILMSVVSLVYIIHDRVFSLKGGRNESQD